MPDTPPPNTTAGFIDLAAQPVITPVPGCRLRTPHGRHLMLSYLEMDDGAEVPLHSHPHEQGGVLLSGTIDFTIGDETRRVTPGSLFLIPANVPHRAVAVGGPATVLDVFSPVREDYAALANRYIPSVERQNPAV
jgi:quercetin dioxygenase-like cupin family protein